MTRTPFFPSIEPYRSGRLKVDGLHELYWEECGAPEGLPVVFLHGGPGAGASPAHRRFFDPRRYRIVVFDQRGAGRSTPLGEVPRITTTPDLVSDIEKAASASGDRSLVRVRRLLGIDAGALLRQGASGSSTRGLFLRGIFLMRSSEIDWFLYGMKTVFPEAWERFVAVPARRVNAATC